MHICKSPIHPFNSASINDRRNPYHTKGLDFLDKAGILTKKNSDVLRTITVNVNSLNEALGYLHQAGILTQENFNCLIANIENSDKLARGFEQLNSAALLTQKYFEVLIKSKDNALTLGLGLWSLHHDDLVTQENYADVIACPEAAWDLALGLALLNQAGILTPENHKELFRGNGAHAKALCTQLNLATPLDQKRFNQIMENVWAPSRFIATMLAVRNRVIKKDALCKKVPLPIEMIAHVAAMSAPNYGCMPPFDVFARAQSVEKETVWYKI